MSQQITSNPIIVSDVDKLVEILAPHLEALCDRVFQRAANRATDTGRMVKYEEAREYLGMGKTQFSKAVSDGTIPSYPNGRRGKLFKISDLIAFEGYSPKTEAERLFEREILNRNK